MKLLPNQPVPQKTGSSRSVALTPYSPNPFRHSKASPGQLTTFCLPSRSCQTVPGWSVSCTLSQPLLENFGSLVPSLCLPPNLVFLRKARLPCPLPPITTPPPFVAFFWPAPLCHGFPFLTAHTPASWTITPVYFVCSRLARWCLRALLANKFTSLGNVGFFFHLLRPYLWFFPDRAKRARAAAFPGTAFCT